MFRTELNLSKSSLPITHGQSILLMGSCFTENIGTRLREAGFRVSINPFGILYNPFSLMLALRKIIGTEMYTAADLFMHRDIWYSWEHHGRFSHSSPKNLLQQINDELLRAHVFLKNADYVFITLGSAHTFYHKSAAKTVANCHKVPQKEFELQLLSMGNVQNILHEGLRLLHSFNPNCRVIFTISPVKHLAYGLVENALGKSILRVAIDEVLKDDNMATYFPAFELVNEDLRDYRFYAPDMMHISDVAVDYIWNKFSETYFNGETQELMKRILNIRKAVAHKILNPQSGEVKKFAQKNLKEISGILEVNPFVDFVSDILYFESLMK